MKDLPVPLQKGELSRLIPVLKDGNKEDKATSILLGGIRGIPSLAKVLLRTVGERVGTRSKIHCYSQVVLLEPKTDALRPDGFLIHENGSKRWLALIESKIGGATLEKDQIVAYADLAKKNDVSAIITISNEFAALPTHHPIKLNANEKKKIEIYHWSWLSILTEALLLQESGDITDPSQSFLLEEFIRFFEHDSAGVKGFTQMNSEWKDLVLSVQSGATLRKQSDEVINTVAAWHQESRELSLILSKELNVTVKEKLPPRHRNSHDQRIKDDADKLVQKSVLESIFYIPDAASDLTVIANLSTRSLTCSMGLSAPDTKTNKSQISWILRQLSKSSNDALHIRSWPKASQFPAQATLKDLREDPSLIIIAGKEKTFFSRFEIAETMDLAGKFSGSKVFIEKLELLVPAFYKGAGQYLKAFVKPAPKPHERVTEESGEEEVKD